RAAGAWCREAARRPTRLIGPWTINNVNGIAVAIDGTTLTNTCHPNAALSRRSRRHYIENHQPSRERELRFFCILRTDEEAVSYAALAQLPSGTRHSHLEPEAVYVHRGTRDGAAHPRTGLEARDHRDPGTASGDTEAGTGRG